MFVYLLLSLIKFLNRNCVEQAETFLEVFSSVLFGTLIITTLNCPVSVHQSTYPLKQVIRTIKGGESGGVLLLVHESVLQYVT